MTRFLTYGEVLQVAEDATWRAPEVRDAGLVESALYRPQASAFGQDAYPTLHLKAAALLQSLATNHGFVDGNKRTALTATAVFLGMNGAPLSLTNDEAVALVLDVAQSVLTDVDKIAERLT